AGIYRVSSGTGSIQLLPDYCFAYRLVRFGFLTEQPHSSATFRARPLWSILGTSGYSVGVVAWPLTQPAPAVRGDVVSDAYHRVAMNKVADDVAATLYPSELQADTIEAAESAIADGATTATGASGDPAAVDPRQGAPAPTERPADRRARHTRGGRVGGPGRRRSAPGSAGSHRSPVRSRGARAGTDASDPRDPHALSEPRCHRSFTPALRDAVRIRRCERQRTAAPGRGARSSICRHRRIDWPGDGF